jgi:hypothetical protein
MNGNTLWADLTCHRVALLTPEALLRVGLSPAAKDPGSRRAAPMPRVREEGAGGRVDQVAGAERVIRAVVSRVPRPWGRGKERPRVGDRKCLGASASSETGRWLRRRGRERGEDAGGRLDDPAPRPFWCADGRGRTIVRSRSRYSGPMLSGSGVTMPTHPGPFRAGNLGRRGECGFVRVRPQPRLLLPGRRIGYRVHRPRVGSDSGAQYRVLACRRQDLMRFWGWSRRDRGRGRCLSGKGGDIFIRRRD